MNNQVQPLKDKISIYFFCLFPLALVTGPLIAEILMNFIVIVFLINIFLKKKFEFFKSLFFIFFISFYFYLVIVALLSEYNSQIIIKTLFYFRFIIFVLAIYEILKLQNNIAFLFFKFLGLTLLLLSIDGIYQYITGENFIGYKMYRPDRVSGFFDDRLVLGGYLIKVLPIFFSLFFFLNKRLNIHYKILSIFIILLTIVTIFISGDRSPFFQLILLLIGLIVFLNLSLKIKFSFVILFLIITSFSLIYFKDLYSRHVVQTVNQLNLKKLDKKPFLKNFTYYYPMFSTSTKAFKDKKIIGYGPNTFRYFCNKPHLITYGESNKVIKNDEIRLDLGWKFIHNKALIKEIIFNENQKLNKGDLLFKYEIDNKIKNFNYNFDHISFVKKIYIQKNLQVKHWKKIADLNIGNFKKETYVPISSCTTHPHHYYFQLISETGIIGFGTVLFIFFYFSYSLLRHLYSKIFYKKTIFNNSQICLILNFTMILLPFSTTGNFFNNWNNMLMYLPIGFYLFFKRVYDQK